jgi:hypothetical protein
MLPMTTGRASRSRAATAEERQLAERLLHDLERERLRVELYPAPDPHFDGHMIRVAVERNPAWYRRFVRWTPAGSLTKRSRVVRALLRAAAGYIRGNGYEAALLKEAS